MTQKIARKTAPDALSLVEARRLLADRPASLTGAQYLAALEVVGAWDERVNELRRLARKEYEEAQALARAADKRRNKGKPPPVDEVEGEPDDAETMPVLRGAMPRAPAWLALTGLVAATPFDGLLAVRGKKTAAPKRAVPTRNVTQANA